MTHKTTQRQPIRSRLEHGAGLLIAVACESLKSGVEQQLPPLNHRDSTALATAVSFIQFC